MRVINPNDESHTITFVPRDYNIGTTTMTIINEGDKSETEASHVISNDGNYMYVIFDLIVSEGSKYSFKITDESSVVYRGRIIVTDQEPQEYDPTTKYYVYE